MGWFFRKAPVLLAAAALMAASISVFSAPRPAFVLERSTNRNQLVYELDPESERPVHPYWRMLEGDGHLEELTALERSHAYGVEVESRAEGFVEFSFRAMPGIHVRAGPAGAEVKLPSGAMLLRRIFLEVGKGLFGAVKEIRLEGERGGLAAAVKLRRRGREWAE